MVDELSVHFHRLSALIEGKTNPAKHIQNCIQEGHEEIFSATRRNIGCGINCWCGRRRFSRRGRKWTVAESSSDTGSPLCELSYILAVLVKKRLSKSPCVIVYVAVKDVLSLSPGEMKAMELPEIVASGCWTLDNKPNRLFAGNREPGFKDYMEAKDLSIVMDTAREYGIPLPSTAVNTQLFNALLEMGWAERENSAVVGVIEKLTDVKLKTQKQISSSYNS